MSDRLPEPLRRRGPLLVTILALGVVFGGVFWWRSARQSASAAYTPPPVEVSVQTVQYESLPQALEATGSLQAVREVMLAPEVSGRVVAINFTAGMTVGAGTPLVQLYDAPERADRAAAVSGAQFAQLQYQRAQELAKTGAGPRQLLQQRQTELAQAQAAIQQLDARILQKTIRAPFAGQIGLRHVNLGQYVNAGDALATLTALDQLYVNFTVPQQELERLDVGGSVTVRTDAFPGRSFTARINAVEPMIGADTRNVSVQATLANPGRILRPGLFVTASVALPPRADALVVPATAIRTSASGDSVFLARDGRVTVVPVVTGQRVGDRVVVERGIKPGDSIITSGQLRVQPGAAVTIAGVPPSQASR